MVLNVTPLNLTISPSLHLPASEGSKWQSVIFCHVNFDQSGSPHIMTKGKLPWQASHKRRNWDRGKTKKVEFSLWSTSEAFKMFYRTSVMFTTWLLSQSSFSPRSNATNIHQVYPSKEIPTWCLSEITPELKEGKLKSMPHVQLVDVPEVLCWSLWEQNTGLERPLVWCLMFLHLHFEEHPQLFA